MTQIPDGQNEIDVKLVQAKRQLEKLALQYPEVITDKVLIENKTQGQKNAETDYIIRLLKAANDLDVLNHPASEGTFGLITTLVRSGLIIRDHANQVEYKCKLLEQKIAKLERQIADLSRVGQRTA